MADVAGEHGRGGAAAEMPGWQDGWPTLQPVLQGRDPQQLQQFMQRRAALEKNSRAIWRRLAAKHLEAAVSPGSVQPNKGQLRGGALR